MEKSIIVLFLIILVVNLTTCEVVDVCTQRDGELSYDGNQKEDGNQQVTINRNFTGNGCKNDHGTLIIRLLEMNLKMHSGCDNYHSLKLKIGSSTDEDICKLTKGDCFIMQEAYYPCADLSVLEKCLILKWKIEDFIYPVTLTFATRKYDSRYSFDINYTYIPCEDGTTGRETTTTAHEDTTTNPRTLTTHSFTTQREEVTDQNSKASDCSEESTVDRILMIVFGILFLVTLVAAIALAIRHIRLIKQADEDDEEATQQSSEPEQPTYSVVNKAAKRNQSSERETVVNELYEMS